MRNGNNSARSFQQSFNYIDPGIPKYQRGDVLTDYRLKVELPKYEAPRTSSMVNPEADPVFQNQVSLTNEGIKALVNLDFSNPAALEGQLKHLQNEGHVPGSFGMNELNSFGRFKTMTEGMDWTDPANYGLARMSFNYLEQQNGNNTKAVDPLITHYLDSLKEENNIPQTMFASRYGTETEAGKKEGDALKEQQKKEFNKYSTAADIAKAGVNLADSIAIQAGATDKDSVNTQKFKNAWSSTSNGVSKLGTAGKMVSIGMDATKFLMDIMPSKTTDKFHADLYSQTELGSSVSGVAHKAEKAEKAMEEAEAKRETSVMQHVADTARDMREAAYFNTDQSYQNYRNKTAGFQPTLSVMSKNGGIIQLTNVGFSLEDEPDLFKKGGQFESLNSENRDIIKAQNGETLREAQDRLAKEYSASEQQALAQKTNNNLTGEALDSIKTDFYKNAYSKVLPLVNSKIQNENLSGDADVITDALIRQMALESNYGTSNIAKTKHNYAGWNATDINPLTNSTAYVDFDDFINSWVGKSMSNSKNFSNIWNAQNIKDYTTALFNTGEANSGKANYATVDGKININTPSRNKFRRDQYLSRLNSIYPSSIQNDLIFNEDAKLASSFKRGGSIESPNGIETTQENIIPEGALHARKHNMSATGFDDSKITKKGIPVINDEGQQQAEIELNEIIFSLEVTKFLEEQYHAYYGTNNSDTKNEIAEKVGDELVYQIIYNTDDRTDLIMAAKQGGVLTPKEEDSIVDNSYDVVLQFFKEVQ